MLDQKLKRREQKEFEKDAKKLLKRKLKVLNDEEDEETTGTYQKENSSDTEWKTKKR